MYYQTRGYFCFSFGNDFIIFYRDSSVRMERVMFWACWRCDVTSCMAHYWFSSSTQCKPWGSSMPIFEKLPNSSFIFRYVLSQISEPDGIFCYGAECLQWQGILRIFSVREAECKFIFWFRYRHTVNNVQIARLGPYVLEKFRTKWRFG